MEASNVTSSDNTIDEREQQLAAREAELAAREQALKEQTDNVQESGTGGATVPKVDTPPQTAEEVQALAEAFAEYRREVAALRNELAAHRKRPPVTTIRQETAEERANAHLELIAQHSHYCPGCGTLGKYAQRCTGPIERPHAAIEMVSTDELSGDPANHTRAPSSDPDELAA